MLPVGCEVQLGTSVPGWVHTVIDYNLFGRCVLAYEEPCYIERWVVLAYEEPCYIEGWVVPTMLVWCYGRGGLHGLLSEDAVLLAWCYG